MPPDDATPPRLYARRVRDGPEEAPGRQKLWRGDSGPGLERFEVFDEVVGLPIGEAEAEKAVVVLDDVVESGEAAIVIEAALGMRPQALQGRGAVAQIGSAARLKIVHADFLGRVQVPARLGKERRNVAGSAPRLPGEELLASGGGVWIEAAARRLGRGNGELIEVQRGKLRSDQIRSVMDVAEVVGRGDRELR